MHIPKQSISAVLTQNKNKNKKNDSRLYLQLKHYLD